MSEGREARVEDHAAIDRNEQREKGHIEEEESWEAKGINKRDMMCS